MVDKHFYTTCLVCKRTSVYKTATGRAGWEISHQRGSKGCSNAVFRREDAPGPHYQAIL